MCDLVREGVGERRFALRGREKTISRKKRHESNTKKRMGTTKTGQHKRRLHGRTLPT